MAEKARASRMRQAALWNTASGMINAGQSAVILIFISRFIGLDAAGVFTIAYALGNLFSTMGKYGIRTFQITDVADRYRFRDYLSARVVTTLGATVLVVVYLLVQLSAGQYSGEKVFVTLLICLWKMIDTVEDVYYGMYQQQGRLDIGAKCYTIRLLFSTAVFCLLLLFSLPLWADSLIVTVLSALSAVLLIRRSLPMIQPDRTPPARERVLSLLKVCLPLFAGTSLSIYVGNAPKYMIDWYLDEATQATFGFIMMPAFVILVLNQFIYQPIIRDLGELWATGDKRRFIRRVMRQYAIVAGLTAVIILVGTFIGLPILSLLYSTDLSAYRAEFVVLLIGGGVYALVSFIMVPLTTIRFQGCIAVGFAAAAVASLLLGKGLVLSSGVMGAAVLYLLLNVLLALFFTACFFWKVRQGKRQLR